MKSLQTLAVSALAIAVLAPVAVTAQRAPIPHEYLPYNLDSGVLSNLTESSEVVVFDQIIEAGGSDWMRIGFSNTILHGESYLRLTSLYDGAVQHLSTNSLAQWQEKSAYFNGSQVQIELVAAPGTSNACKRCTRPFVPTPGVRSRIEGYISRPEPILLSSGKLID